MRVCVAAGSANAAVSTGTRKSLAAVGFCISGFMPACQCNADASLKSTKNQGNFRMCPLLQTARRAEYGIAHP